MYVLLSTLLKKIVPWNLGQNVITYSPFVLRYMTNIIFDPKYPVIFSLGISKCHYTDKILLYLTPFLPFQFLSIWTILTSTFDVYCLHEAKPGSSHTGFYIFSFDFVYVGNPHSEFSLINIPK